MNKIKKISYKGKVVYVLVCNSYIIIKNACKCGHGVQINNDSYTAICSWRCEKYELHHELVDDIRKLCGDKK